MLTGNPETKNLLGLFIHGYMELNPPMSFPSTVSASPFPTMRYFYASAIKDYTNSFF